MCFIFKTLLTQVLDSIEIEMHILFGLVRENGSLYFAYLGKNFVLIGYVGTLYAKYILNNHIKQSDKIQKQPPLFVLLLYLEEKPQSFLSFSIHSRAEIVQLVFGDSDFIGLTQQICSVVSWC